MYIFKFRIVLTPCRLYILTCTFQSFIPIIDVKLILWFSFLSEKNFKFRVIFILSKKLKFLRQCNSIASTIYYRIFQIFNHISPNPWPLTSDNGVLDRLLCFLLTNWTNYNRTMIFHLFAIQNPLYVIKAGLSCVNELNWFNSWIHT